MTEAIIESADLFCILSLNSDLVLIELKATPWIFLGTDVVADAPGSVASVDLVRREMNVHSGSNNESLIVAVFLGVEC